MVILIHLERSDAMASEHHLPAGRTTVTYDAPDGNWAQLTYNALRTQDGRELITVDDGEWLFDGEPFSDVIVEFAEAAPPKPHDEACVLHIDVAGDYCGNCGWHREGHPPMACCADWCGLHVSHDGPCRER